MRESMIPDIVSIAPFPEPLPVESPLLSPPPRPPRMLEKSNEPRSKPLVREPRSKPEPEKAPEMVSISEEMSRPEPLPEPPRMPLNASEIALNALGSIIPERLERTSPMPPEAEEPPVEEPAPATRPLSESRSSLSRIWPASPSLRPPRSTPPRRSLTEPVSAAIAGTIEQMQRTTATITPKNFFMTIKSFLNIYINSFR